MTTEHDRQELRVQALQNLRENPARHWRLVLTQGLKVCREMGADNRYEDETIILRDEGMMRKIVHPDLLPWKRSGNGTPEPYQSVRKLTVELKKGKSPATVFVGIEQSYTLQQFTPGVWVEYLLLLAEEVNRQERYAAQQARERREGAADDAHLFQADQEPAKP